ncbi:MAG: DEAD/DEAH box helicase, partial [Actinobacteria bacterium]|nr:DEAD/DEAH box helicase [Actinomycetota bacterium]
MARSIRLRRWQKAALDAFNRRTTPDFLAVATPGAGKTTFALAAARQCLAQWPGRRLVVVAPTQHLKSQWADAAAAFDLHLDPRWDPGAGSLPGDVHGVVTTYQQVASRPEAFTALVRDGAVVLDEVHHAGDDRAWGDAVREAFSAAGVRLCLSGTPFRSDTQAIPFVRYDDDDMAVSDVEYGYGSALRDGGVVRPVHFPRVDGEMEWIDHDGISTSASFSDHLDRTRAGQRLRTALSTDGGWLPDVLMRAHTQLQEVRETHPEAGGLVIATDQEHARGIARLFRERLGIVPAVAVSEDPDASRRIAEFAAGTDPWIVAVRMISEGVDIPRLRVGVMATTTGTELFFRQAVGRLVRWIRGLGPQPAYMFIPDDVRLRTHAFAITEERRHSLRRPERDDEALGDDAAFDEVGAFGAQDEQMSLFAAVSSRAIETDAPRAVAIPELLAGDEPDDDEDLVLILEPAPHLTMPATASGGDGPTPAQRRRQLRETNAAAVAEISRLTGDTHASVNRQLNGLTGVTKVGEATVDQL